jgi:hypothetical protein
LAASITFEILNVKDGVANPVLLEILNVKDGVTNPVLPSYNPVPLEYIQPNITYKEK